MKNHALCNQCQTLVPAEAVERDGKVYLVKHCSECGATDTLISSVAERYWKKRSADLGFDYRGCRLDCLQCHHRKQPNIVFVDVTNRCNLNCPICINNTPSMGFLFEPPFEYFDKIFHHLATLSPKPSVQLFGGEPTMRDDLHAIVARAKLYGLAARIVTNGIKLADPDYCRRTIDSGATILMAYDGSRPELYERLRGSSKMLEKKLRALDNVSDLGGTKGTLMTLIAKGFNDDEIGDMFRLCHERRNCIRAIYFMPLAHTWKSEAFDLDPERTTSEDIEEMVDATFPDDRVEFLPAGLIGQLESLLACISGKTIPFAGAHPNCESLYILISDGEAYRPLGRYLKHSIFDAASDVAEVERKLARHAAKCPHPTRWQRKRLKARALFSLIKALRKHVRFREVLKGKTRLSRLRHAVAAMSGFAFGKRTRHVLDRHTRVQHMLQVIVLPFEDAGNIETERLERCPAAFAFYDPESDDVRHVPVCAWGLHKTETMRRIAAHYQTHR